MEHDCFDRFLRNYTVIRVSIRVNQFGFHFTLLPQPPPPSRPLSNALYIKRCGASSRERQKALYWQKKRVLRNAKKNSKFWTKQESAHSANQRAEQPSNSPSGQPVRRLAS